MDDNIIPINRGVIEALTKLLGALKDVPWKGPKSFNAILIDRKDFMKTMAVPNPPPPVIEIAVRSRMEFRMVAGPIELAQNDRVRFDFWRRIGDTLEYREY